MSGVGTKAGKWGRTGSNGVWRANWKFRQTFGFAEKSAGGIPEVVRRLESAIVGDDVASSV